MLSALLPEKFLVDFRSIIGSYLTGQTLVEKLAVLLVTLWHLFEVF